MKKLFYIFLSLLAVSFTVTACSDDDDDNGMSFNNTPEKDAAGIYEGTFTRQRGGSTDVEKAAGTMEIIADSAYFADFHFLSTEFNLNVTSVANISHANKGFVFYNNLPANPVGSAWAGRINDDGAMSLTFQIRQRVGRRTYTYNYTFEGQRKL